MTLAIADVKKSVKLRLGNETVTVELGDFELDECIKNARLKLDQYAPALRRDSYRTPAAGGIFVHSCDSSVSGVYEIDLTLIVQSQINSGLSIESAMLAGAPVYYGVGDTIMDIQYYDLRRRWIKTIGRELGADPDYAIIRNPTTNLWDIYTFSTSGLLVDLVVTKAHTADLATIPAWKEKWFLDWVLTEAQLIVGRKRNKWVSVPVAGGRMENDGIRMITQAEKMQEKLEANLQASRADLFPRFA